MRFLVTVLHYPVSNADAFDLAITDVLPAVVAFVSATFTGGVTPSSFVPGGGGGFTATWAGFPLGSASTFELVATVNAGVTSGVTLNNTATLAYFVTALPAVHRRGTALWWRRQHRRHGGPRTTTSPWAWPVVVQPPA